MFKKFSILLIALTLTLTACDELQKAATTILTQQVISNEDIANGLKSALEIGIVKGSDVLSQKGGFFNCFFQRIGVGHEFLRKPVAGIVPALKYQ